MSVLDALLLISPSAVCASDEAAGRRAAQRATDAIERRLNRSLIVRPAAQPALRWMDGREHGWARQWPVVLLTTARPTAAAPLDASPAEVEGALYRVEDALFDDGCDLGDETGEKLGLPALPDDCRAFYIAGHRRDDQLGEAGRAAVNAAIEAAHPTWGPEAVAAEAWARTPLLPPEIRSAATELARGYLALDGTGLGAIRQRRQEREESSHAVTLDVDWEERLLAPLDPLAWIDL